MLGGWAWWSFAGQVFQHECETSAFACVFPLQLEVSQLEGSLQQPKAQSAMSPYLVPDTQALCQHLALVKQLATSGRFIIIIPRTGMSTPQQVTVTGCLSLLCWEQAPGVWIVAFPPPALMLDFIWNTCNMLLMCCFWGQFYVWDFDSVSEELREESSCSPSASPVAAVYWTVFWGMGSTQCLWISLQK